MLFRSRPLSFNAPWLSWLQRPTVRLRNHPQSEGREFEPHWGRCILFCLPSPHVFEHDYFYLVTPLWTIEAITQQTVASKSWRTCRYGETMSPHQQCAWLSFFQRPNGFATSSNLKQPSSKTSMPPKLSSGLVAPVTPGVTPCHSTCL